MIVVIFYFRNLVDLNRAGVPLIEIVFAPDLCDGYEAAALVKELILILRKIETCSCKMEGTFPFIYLIVTQPVFSDI